jgi:hypothetical protein
LAHVSDGQVQIKRKPVADIQDYAGSDQFVKAGVDHVDFLGPVGHVGDHITASFVAGDRPGKPGGV